MIGRTVAALFVALLTFFPDAARCAEPARRFEASRLQGLCLLREPSHGAAMVKALKAGELVAVLDRQGDFVKARTESGLEGYLYAGYLTGFEDVPVPEAFRSRLDASVTRPEQPARASRPVPADPLASAPVAAAPVPPGGDGMAEFVARIGAGQGGTAEAPAGRADPSVKAFQERASRYAIEVSLSRCLLSLYEKKPDGGRALVRTYSVATPGKNIAAPEGWGVITDIEFDPWWFPTANLKRKAIQKGKTLPDSVRPGDKGNAMGAFKMHLSHGFAYRIHGNNDPRSIGRRVTNGCIRMKNDEGKELARTVGVGAEVVFTD